MGILLFVLHLVVYFCVWTAGVVSYARATEENPFPTVFGLSFELQGPVFVSGVILAELLFVAALYVAGPEWRRQFGQLFKYRPPGGPPSEEASGPPPTFRYRLGLTVFVVGNVLATTGMLLPVFGLAKGRMIGVIAVILGAGEVISLSSIFFLGKQGFKELKSRLFSALKRPPSGEAISRRRHRVGCALFAAHITLGFVALIFPIGSHFGVAAEGTFPTVLGLGRDQQMKWFIGLLIASELLFYAGVYTLGADWWERFRDLFRSEPRREPLLQS